jgi:hypothetical protein
MNDTEKNISYKRTIPLNLIVVSIFGVVFIVVLLILSIVFPTPTIFMYTVFRIVLALAAAGVAAIIPGFIKVNIKSFIVAGGALAVFAIVYFFNPAQLIIDDKQIQYQGYIHNTFIDNNLNATSILNQDASLRSGPSFNDKQIKALDKGQKLVVLSELGEWVQVKTIK